MSKGYRKTLIAQAALAALCTQGLWSGAEARLDLSRALSRPGLNAERTSIAVVDAASGRPIVSHQPNLRLNPASCMKIITSAAALHALGPDYRFQTYIYADREPKDGAVGTLYIYGTGDPSLVNERIWLIARNLYDLGLRRIEGDIVIDNSYFDSDEFPRKAGADHRAYAARTSAVAANFNSVTLRIDPAGRKGQNARISLEPPVDHIGVVNHLVTGGKFQLDISQAETAGGETITVRGRIPAKSEPRRVYTSVADPVAYAGAVFRFILEQNGIEVTGGTKGGRTPQNAFGLANEGSEPLSSIIKSMNKFSNNFMAEQIVKHLGAIRFGVPGSTAKGIQAIENYLASIGIRRRSYIIENGSGLSDKNRVSSAQLAKVLSAAYQDFSIRPELVASFPIFGVDGTMESWNFFPELRSQLRAKTGTLGGVSSLAGFVELKDGRTAAFAILANGLPRGPDAARRAQLGIVKAIAEATP